MKVSMIVAADEQNGIGKDNALLCHLPNDLKFFKKTTSGYPILMGRKTFESIGKPLPKRRNIVISRSSTHIEGCEVFGSIEAALAAVQHEEQVFMIGGDSIYQQSLAFCEEVILTRIHHRFEADAFFPELTADTWELKFNARHEKDEKHDYAYSFQLYRRR
jgi:dihydrofolate reductase